jgi:pimeloyl-ACP methyl ester carboxylesterase
MLTSVPEKKFLDLHRLRFHYVDWGGQGQPLVLLHGLASNARFWDLVAPYLSAYRVLAIDQRGHGSTSKTTIGYDFRTVSEDIAGLIKDLDISRPVIVGHSWGGNVAMQVAYDNPELLAGIVCIDGGLIEPSSFEGATWEETSKAMTPPDFVSLKLTWASFLERMSGTEIGILWGDNLHTFLRANFEIQSDGTILPRLSMQNHMSIVRAIWDQEVSKLFDQITCPVLMIPARRLNEASSSGTPDKKQIQADLAEQLIPTSRVIWMEDSIHDVPVQRPKEIAEAIINCLQDGFFHR